MKVEALYVYPVKSLRGLSLETADLDDHGFTYDRNFVLLKVKGEGDIGYGTGRLDASRTEYMSIADIPWMCLFEVTKLEDEKMTIKFHKSSTSESDSIEIPLRPEIKDLDRVETEMWQSKLDGYVMEATYNDWFSERFGYEVIFVYVGPQYRDIIGNIVPDAATRNPERKRQWQAQQKSWTERSVSDISGLARSWFSPQADDDYKIAFADYAPLLIVSSRSCENVSGRLPEGETMDIRKFRPNIIVEGAESAFEEDYWAELSVGGDSNILLTSNCVRCTSLNVDFNTGKVGEGESGKVLKKLQVDRRIDEGAKYSPVFGRYGFLTRRGPASVRLKVGDSVVVSRRNEHVTTFKWPGFGSTGKEDYYPV